MRLSKIVPKGTSKKVRDLCIDIDTLYARKVDLQSGLYAGLFNEDYAEKGFENHKELCALYTGFLKKWADYFFARKYKDDPTVPDVFRIVLDFQVYEILGMVQSLIETMADLSKDGAGCYPKKRIGELAGPIMELAEIYSRVMNTVKPAS